MVCNSISMYICTCVIIGVCACWPTRINVQKYIFACMWNITYVCKTTCVEYLYLCMHAGLFVYLIIYFKIQSIILEKDKSVQTQAVFVHTISRHMHFKE